nr:MAG: putative RNA polymerase [Eriocheir sinensis tombusvirus 1]
MIGRDLSKCRGVLRLQPNGLRAKSRTFVVVRDIGPTHNLGVYNNNIETVGRAFEERYFLCKTEEGFKPALFVRPKTYQNNQWLSQFRDTVSASCAHAPIMPLRSVVEAYVGSKRRVYEDAYASLQRDPLTELDARLTSFVKYEKQDLGKAPRVINPRSPRYNLVLGKYLKFLEKKVYRGINKAFGGHTRHTVIKGLNVMEAGKVVQAKWRRFRNPVAIGLDASKFDMHTSVPALKFEHSVYYSIFPQAKELRKLLSWQLRNQGIAYCEDGRVKFSMEGTRSSGDLNTSLGNCIIMCGLIYAYLRERNVDGELMNNGDDCVVIVEAEDLERFMHRLPEWFEVAGYRMTVEAPVYELEEIEFCQSRVVLCEGEPVMVRNLTNSILKDPMCLVPVQNNNVLKMWYQAVGDCGHAITAGIPVLQEYYKMFKRVGKTYTEGFLQQVQKNTSHLTRMRGIISRAREVAAATRCSFYYAFGILPAYQIELEEAFKRTTLLDGVETLFHEDLSVDKYDNCPLPVVQYMF